MASGRHFHDICHVTFVLLRRDVWLSAPFTLGARRLSAMCAELEAATRDELPPDAAERVADVERELARARSAFETIAANAG